MTDQQSHLSVWVVILALAVVLLCVAPWFAPGWTVAGALGFDGGLLLVISAFGLFAKALNDA